MNSPLDYLLLLWPEFLKLSKGDYASERVGDTYYYAFEDRKRVCFVSNVFPERMDSDVVRVQLMEAYNCRQFLPCCQLTISIWVG